MIGCRYSTPSGGSPTGRRPDGLPMDCRWGFSDLIKERWAGRVVGEDATDAFSVWQWRKDECRASEVASLGRQKGGESHTILTPGLGPRLRPPWDSAVERHSSRTPRRWLPLPVTFMPRRRRGWRLPRSAQAWPAWRHGLRWRRVAVDAPRGVFGVSLVWFHRRERSGGRAPPAHWLRSAASRSPSREPRRP
jgi:hypothetical protein